MFVLPSAAHLNTIVLFIVFLHEEKGSSCCESSHGYQACSSCKGRGSTCLIFSIVSLLPRILLTIITILGTILRLYDAESRIELCSLRNCLKQVASRNEELPFNEYKLISHQDSSQLIQGDSLAHMSDGVVRNDGGDGVLGLHSLLELLKNHCLGHDSQDFTI